VSYGGVVLGQLFFHVTSSRNRDSVLLNGLDWTRMGGAPGIAGSPSPEQDGCFLCLSEFDVEWFVDLNNTGGTVDVWAIDGVDEDELIESPEGHYYVARVIPATRLVLLRQDIAPRSRWTRDTDDGGSASVSVVFRAEAGTDPELRSE